MSSSPARTPVHWRPAIQSPQRHRMASLALGAMLCGRVPTRSAELLLRLLETSDLHMNLAGANFP